MRVRACAQGYLQPLKQAIGSGGKRDEFGLDEADLKVIFSSIKIIINFHRYVRQTCVILSES
jgi:hypothetical protein